MSVLVFSTGQIRDRIAEETGQPLDRDAVAYALRKADVKPIGRAGLVRLFAPSAVATVRDFLDGKRQRRTKEESK